MHADARVNHKFHKERRMNVSSMKDCFGCGVCALSCSRKAIKIELNDAGFYEPVVDSKKCNDCGICLSVCSYNANDIALKNYVPKSSFGAWSKDKDVRRKCSSGGVGFEIARSLLNSGYLVIGCKYNVGNERAEHYVANTLEELIPSIGSKYIQSYTLDGFIQIDRKKKYLVTGTPCQIDSFRRYIRKFKCEDNFILMDFFCHGVPSKWMWDKYVRWAETKVGKLTYVSWRNKQTGWHDSWAMAIDGEEHGEKVNWHDSYNMLIKEKKSFLNSRLSQGDIFYKLFLGNICLGKACYNKCRFKYNQSSADIRIGDAWGPTYNLDDLGVSSVIVFTDRGDNVVANSNCVLQSHPFEVVAEYQMRANPQMPFLYNRMISTLSDTNTSLNDALTIFRIQKKIDRAFGILSRMKSRICRIWK